MNTVAVRRRARQLGTSTRAFMATRLTPLLPKHVPPAPTAQDWANARLQLERILTENIVPFWYPRAMDLEYGGYRLNHDIPGAWLGPTNNGLGAQGGRLWLFSAPPSTPVGTAAHLQTAPPAHAVLQ